MLDALRSLLAPPALVVLAGVVAAVAAFARLFRRPRPSPSSSHTRARSELFTLLATARGKSRPDPFDAFLRSLDDDRGDELG